MYSIYVQLVICTIMILLYFSAFVAKISTQHNRHQAHASHTHIKLTSHQWKGTWQTIPDYIVHHDSTIQTFSEFMVSYILYRHLTCQHNHQNIVVRPFKLAANSWVQQNSRMNFTGCQEITITIFIMIFNLHRNQSFCTWFLYPYYTDFSFLRWHPVSWSPLVWSEGQQDKLWIKVRIKHT